MATDFLFNRNDILSLVIFHLFEAIITIRVRLISISASRNRFLPFFQTVVQMEAVYRSIEIRSIANLVLLFRVFSADGHYF